MRMRVRVLPHNKKLQGLRVLYRVDFNVKVGPKGEIGHVDDERIRAVLPTLSYMRAAGAKIIIMSHLGRPEKKNKKDSLEPVAKHLGKLIGKRILFVGDSLEKGNKADKKLADLKDGDVAVLENLRFYRSEEKNDRFFARRLAELGDVLVNDAFGVAHRETASTVGLATELPAYAGFLMDEEVKGLQRVLDKPRKPFVMLIGGVKISTKLPMLKKLLGVADRVLIGGGMANNFFKAMGYEVGDSLVSRPDIALAKTLMKKRKIRLPKDVLVADKLTLDAVIRICAPDAVKKGENIVDIGPETMRAYAAELKKAQTIIWNGPVGLFEIPRFGHGSVILARVVASRSSGRAYGVVGGGDTLRCLAMTGMGEFVDHVSTGGGAMLDFFAGKNLPGVVPLLVTKSTKGRKK